MAVSSTAGLVWIWLVFPFLSVGTLPWSGPPQPLDPVLSAIAPAECIWYAASAGVAEADAQSSNRSEQLFAEPQFRAFAAAVEHAVLAALEKQSQGNPQETVLAQNIPLLIKAFLQQPWAVFVEEISFEAENLQMQAGLALRTGEQKQVLTAALDAVVNEMIAGGLPIGASTVEGQTEYSLRISMETPEIHCGWHGEYLLVAVGENAWDRIVARMDGTPPAWLGELRERHAVPRESKLNYLNVPRIAEAIQAVSGEEELELWFGVLGIRWIQAVEQVSGFDAEGCVSSCQMRTVGSREGLLGLLPYKPLGKRDLQLLPPDALVAGAVRLDPHECYKMLMRTVSELQPQAGESWKELMQRAEDKLGVDIETDILRELDDVQIAYMPAGDLLTAWTGSVVGLRVKDAARLRSAFDKLLSAWSPDVARPFKLKRSTFDDGTIHYVQFKQPGVPVTPAWCVGDEWLVLGLSPQSVQAVLEHGAWDDSLAKSDSVREAMDAAPDTASLLYCDTENLVRRAYPLLQMALPSIAAVLEQNAVEFDLATLPTADTIARHLRPTVSTQWHAGDGFHWRSKQSLPGGGSGGLVLPALQFAGVGFVRVQQAPVQDAVDLNRMKQLCLAMFNYHDVHGHFPDDIRDADGKALLSWRVQLLPYLEVPGLSIDSFHLDEAWDSEHNGQFLGQSPAPFQSENPTEAGTTRILRLAGNETSFPPSKGLKIQHISDGTSNTIMIVQAASNRAVPWTKPADLPFDKAHPLEGLSTPVGRFIAGFCDGSVSQLNCQMPDEVMRALVTRNGKEVANRSAAQ